METQSSRRRAGAAAAAAGLTVAVALVAMAGRAPLARSTPVNASSASAPTTALLTLLAGAGIVMLGALAVLLWQNRRRRGDDDDELETQPLQVHWIWQLLSILFALAVGGALVAAAVIGTRSHNAVPTFVPGGAAGPALTAPTTANGSGAGFVLPGWLPWTVLGIVVVALAVGVVALVRWLNPPVDASSERTAASAAVEAAIGALEDSSDPRDAVIRAYAAMQGTLAAHGVVRSPSEAPREYLRRVLVANAGSEREARTLTGLFEEARFSTHPISERVRQIALAALGSLRARLGADGTAG